MTVVVDTDVPIVANRAAPQASPTCIAECSRRLEQIKDHERLVLDDDWRILREYMANLRSKGQPGPGDEFLKWVLTNRADPARCTIVRLTPQDDSFVEFPEDPELADFDRSDRKFAAVAHEHPDHPPVLNATDSDWYHYREALERYDIHVDFVCPDYEFKER
jgi:hypothetical protein